MGVVTLIVVALAFLAAAAAAYLPAPGWVGALAVTLVLVPLAVLCVLGWAARARLRGWPDRAWGLVPGTMALALVAVAYLTGTTGSPDAARESIPLGAWALSGGCIAGLVAALGYGLTALGSGDRRVRVLGSAVALAAFLAAQPVLASWHLPVVGPLGLAGAVAVVVAAGWLRRRFGGAAPGSPDPR